MNSAWFSYHWTLLVWRPQDFDQKHNSTGAGGRQSSLSSAPGQESLPSAIVLQVRELSVFQLFQETHMQRTISNISFLSFPLGDQQFQLLFLALFSRGTANVLSGVESFMVLLDPSSNLWHSVSISAYLLALNPLASTPAEEEHCGKLS